MENYQHQLYGSHLSDSSSLYQEDNNASTPRTPPDSPAFNTNRIPVNAISDALNQDLLNGSDLFDSLYKIPPMETLTSNIYSVSQSPALEVQSTMKTPYMKLEFIACFSLNMILCSNSFMLALVDSKQDILLENIFRYVLFQIINLACLGFMSYIFTSPDTYKSINITIKYLAINSIVYEYKFSIILKYIGIHLCAGILASLASIGIYHDLITDIPTSKLLSVIFATKRSFSISYSYILVSIMMHFSLSAGLTILTNTTTTINSRIRALQKALLTLFVSITFGAVIGPIGHIWPYLSLYSMVILTRREYDSFNLNLFITYASTILAIIVFYPLMAIQIKFFWRNRYRRYIEYGL